MSKDHLIQVIGSGCSGCKRLHLLTVEVVTEMDLPEEVEYVTDVTKLIELGIMQSPALLVDGQVVLAGFIPDRDQIREALLKVIGE